MPIHNLRYPPTPSVPIEPLCCYQITESALKAAGTTPAIAYARATQTPVLTYAHATVLTRVYCSDARATALPHARATRTPVLPYARSGTDLRTCGTSTRSVLESEQGRGRLRFNSRSYKHVTMYRHAVYRPGLYPPGPVLKHDEIAEVFVLDGQICAMMPMQLSGCTGIGERAYDATKASAYRYNQAGTDERDVREAVLESEVALEGDVGPPIVLRQPYAMSSTETAYATIYRRNSLLSYESICNVRY
eukprot:3940591-Rhodomonas_salina.1